MATGEILSAVVRADGWSMDVTIEGFTTGATYDFGSLDDTPATVTAPMFSVAVVSEGYSAAGVLGTVARTVYGTHVVRKPYPDQASKDETVSGSDLVVRVALSESIYNDDKNGGAGTSGTNPAVTISAAWATNTGGGAQTSAVATALACTNNSTLDYPKCIAQWAWGHTPGWRGVTADFTIGCIAYHGHGVACVILSATDTHAGVVSGTKTSKTDHTMSVPSLHYESYDLACPIASFTSGDDITLKFVAYPLVGDADSIIDTSTNTTSTNDILGLTQITCRYVSSEAALYVAATDHPTTPGNDTTGDGTTALPYATIGKALDVLTDAAGKRTTIYAKTGGTVLGILGSTPASVASTGCFIEVMPNPGDTVTLDRGATFIQFKGTKVRYSDFNITGNNFLDGNSVASAKLWFHNCTFSPATVHGTIGLGYRSEGCWFTECSWSTRDNWSDIAALIGYAFTGCLHSAGANMEAIATFVATKITGGAADATRMTDKNSSTSPITSNLIYANSAFLAAATSGASVVRIGDNEAKDGIAIVGNLLEAKSGAQPLLWVGGDSNMQNLNNIILAHNTVIGQRANLFYNDLGVSANVRTNIFFRNNALSAFAIKSDTFATENGARIGNWAQMNGVNISDNRYSYKATYATFICDYNGINVAYVDVPEAVANDLGFTDDNSFYGDGTGNGDYMPTEASVLYDHTLRQAYQSFDLYGVAL